jgi:NAD(P)-dependent dehydrogenase (short-subunit alcohol dehydrogenase family)
MDFTGKRVLVTGSSRGIGQALARHFRSGGWAAVRNWLRHPVTSRVPQDVRPWSISR